MKKDISLLNRYWLFAYFEPEPEGALNDLEFTSDNPFTVIEFIDNFNDSFTTDYQIVDIKTGQSISLDSKEEVRDYLIFLYGIH